MPGLTVIVITRDEARPHRREALRARCRLGRRAHRRRQRQHRRHRGDRAAGRRAGRGARLAGLRRPEEPRGVARRARLDPVAGRRRARHAGAGRRDPADCCAPSPRPPGYRIPRVTRYLGRWIRTTDWYPDWQLRLYDRRRARWSDATGPRVGAGRRAACCDCAASSSTTPTATSRHHVATIDRYTTLAAERDGRGGHDQLGPAARRRTAIAAFLRNYLLQARHPRRRGRARHLGDQRVLRLAEAREAAGTTASDGPACRSAARYDAVGGSRQAHVLAPHRHGAHLARRPEPGAADRDGAARARPPHGARRASRRRAAPARGRGPRPHPARARATRWTSSAAWRLARVLRSERPHIVHAHDPHGVAMASLAISLQRRSCRRRSLVASRRVDFPLKTNAFSRWKYRQVDVFICASEAIRRIVWPAGHRARPPRDRARGHRPRARRRGAAGGPARAVLAAARRARSSATSARSCRTRDSATSSTPPRSSLQAGARRALRHRRRGRAARASSRRRSGTSGSRSTCS